MPVTNMTFESTSSYIKAYKANADLAGVPISAAAEYFHITPAGVAAMIKTGKIKFVKIGRTKLITLKSILDLETEFEDHVDKVEKVLINMARKGTEKVFYEPIMTPIGLKTTTPADRNYIGRILGRISERSTDKHSFLLSVLVHRSTAGKTKPGPGFFDLAKALDYKIGNQDDFIETQTAAVLKYYRGK